MTPYVLIWLVAANGIAFALMAADKRRAETRARRISESTLLRWALFGGAFGTFAASRILRHKTRKQPFAGRMAIILALEIVLLALWASGVLKSLFA
jgi:uncharacterized membrane protein YsdA (DUF1294 family)